MAKKINLKSVLDNADDAAARAEQNKRLASIKPLGIRDIVLESIELDRTFNVREDDAYSKENNLELYASLREFGIDQTKPLMAVSERKKLETGEGSDPGQFVYWLALRGNLRLSMIRLINEEEIAAGRPPEFRKIPVLVYQNLTPVEELLIMADHTGSKELNKFEQYGMIARAYEARHLTYDNASAYFGVNRNTVQRAVTVYSMPPVYDNLRLQVHEDENALPIGQKEITFLYKAYQSDLAGNGIPRDCNGPAFKDAWRIMLENWQKADDRGPIRKAKSGGEIEAVKSSVGSIKGLAGELAGRVLDWTLGAPISISNLTESIADKIATTERRLERTLGDLEIAQVEINRLNALLGKYVDTFGALPEEKEILTPA